MTDRTFGARWRPVSWIKVAGWSVLLLGLPLAFFAIIHPPNEYRAMGFEALDCDGPGQTYLFAVPALLLYGIGFLANVRRWRAWGPRIVALGCFLVCTLVMINVAKAVTAQSKQSADCRSR